MRPQERSQAPATCRTGENNDDPGMPRNAEAPDDNGAVLGAREVGSVDGDVKENGLAAGAAEPDKENAFNAEERR